MYPDILNGVYVSENSAARSATGKIRVHSFKLPYALMGSRGRFLR